MPSGRHAHQRPLAGEGVRKPQGGTRGPGGPKLIPFEISRRAAPGYVAAVLGDHHTLQSRDAWKDVPPGHRFQLYFHGMADMGSVEAPDGPESKKERDIRKRAAYEGDWDTLRSKGAQITQQWLPLKDQKRTALQAAAGMGKTASDLLYVLASRADALRGPDVWWREAVLIAPLATGLGNPHPVENGFAFLSPYGVPYLAGSGVKGVLRRAAEELALFDADSPWTLAQVWALFGFDENSGCFADEERANLWRQAYAGWVAGVCERRDAVLDAWLAAIGEQLPRESRDLAPVEFLDKLANSQPLRRAIHWQGLLAFQDAFPDKNAGLEVDILNPHHRDYYAKTEASPHDAENPVPVFFLTVAPGARFAFTARPLRGREALWQAIGECNVLLNTAFEHACDWLGFGAKKAVGYGTMEHKLEKATRPGNQQGAAPKPRVAFWEAARITWTKGNQTLSASVAGRKAQRVGQEGKTLLDSLPEGLRKRLDQGREVIAPVEVEPLGNAWRLVGIVAGPAAAPK